MKKRKRILFLAISFVIPLMATVAILSTYGMVKSYVNSTYENPFEKKASVEKLFKGHYVLYKNLYEKIHGENVQYTDLYIQDEAAFIEDIFSENILYSYSGEKVENYVKADSQSLINAVDSVLKTNLEEDFFSILPYFDYYVEDLTNAICISNASDIVPNREKDYFYYLEIIYDENGNASIGTANSEDSELLQKNAAEIILQKNRLLQECIGLEGELYGFYIENLLSYNGVEPDMSEYGTGPKNCRIIYGMTAAVWQKYMNAEIGGDFGYSTIYTNTYYTYQNSGVMSWIALAALAVMLLALYLPLNRLTKKPFSEIKCVNLPIEIVATAFCLLLTFHSEILDSIIKLLSGNAAKDVVNLTKIHPYQGEVIAWWLHALLLYGVFLAVWYLGLTIRPLREKGFARYLKENWLFYRIFPFIKKKALKVYDDLEHIDVTKKAGKTIFRIVLVNAVILFIISLMWVGGVALIIVYSIVLYFLLKLYVSRMQKKYTILLHKINEISQGNLNVEIKEDLGIFNPFKEQLLQIQTGFRSAVEEEVKSQKMKSELITNVSHDLKTPLTAIITYVDLLKDENVSEEKRKEYLDTLERKSLRLKVLIEDLFEVSKANSGNVTLRYMDVDICNLVKQVQLEMSDKLEAANLDVRMDLPDEKVIVALDSQRTYRIYENLFQNIAKYSLPGTRVYVQGSIVPKTHTFAGSGESELPVSEEKEIVISLKNISAAEITVNASDLTERFVRGDAARNTEGSGLGLAIVKSFVELQGGRFILEHDGDLFKAVTVFTCK